MPNYLYQPIPNDESQDRLYDWQSGLMGKGKLPIIALRANDPASLAAGGNALAGLRPGDKIYIIAHGVTYQGSSTPLMGDNNMAGQFVTCTPAVLARNLRAQGLPYCPLELNLYFCDSATATAQSNSFGQDFRIALNSLGYANITLSGYHGEVVPQYMQLGQGGLTINQLSMLPVNNQNRHKGSDVNGLWHRAMSQKVRF